MSLYHNLRNIKYSLGLFLLAVGTFFLIYGGLKLYYCSSLSFSSTKKGEFLTPDKYYDLLLKDWTKDRKDNDKLRVPFLYWKRGEIKKAITILRKEYRENNDKEVGSMLASFYCKIGEIQECVSLYNELYEKTKDVNYLLEIARNYEKKGWLNEAYSYYNKVLKKEENNKEALYFLANYYAENNQIDFAIELYKRILKLDKSDCNLYIALGSLYQLKGMCKEGIEYLLNIIQSKVGGCSDKVKAMAWGSLANCYYKDKDILKAKEALSNAMILAPDSIELYLIAIPIAINEENYDIALNYIKHVIGKFGDRWELWYWWGYIEYIRGNLEVASEKYKKAVELTKKEQIEPILGLFKCYIRVGNFDELLNEYSMLPDKIKSSNSELELLRLIAYFYRSPEKYELNNFLEFKKNFSDLKDVYCWAASLEYKIKKNINGALKLINEGLIQNSESVVCLDLLLSIYCETRQYTKAFEIYKKLINTNITERYLKKYLEDRINYCRKVTSYTPS